MADDSDRLKAAETVARGLRSHLLAIPQHLDVSSSQEFGRTIMQLTFWVNRQNYISLLASLDSNHVIPAAQLARSLLEESIRWEWLTDDPEKREPVLTSELRKNMQLIVRECAAIGADPGPFLNPSPFFNLHSPEPTPISRGFPSYEQMLRDIQAKLDRVELPFKVNFLSIYAMYRVLSQLTHTSILGMIATVQVSSDADLSVGQELPVPLRALVVHAGAASVVNVSRYCVYAFADNEEDKYDDWLREALKFSEGIASLIGSVHGLTTFR